MLETLQKPTHLASRWLFVAQRISLQPTIARSVAPKVTTKALLCKFVSSTAHSSEFPITGLVPISLLLSAYSAWLEDEQQQQYRQHWYTIEDV